MLPKLILALLATALTAAARPNVVLVLHNSAVVPDALRALHARLGSDACDCLITTEDNLTPTRLAQADVLFLEHPREPFLTRLRDAARARRGLKVTSDVPDVVARAWDLPMPVPLHRRLLAYWQNGGEENMFAFLLLLYQEAGGRLASAIPAPITVARTGIYHPDAPRLFPNLTEYLAWYRPTHPGLGALATVNFYNTFLKNRDTAFLDAQLRALEHHGLAAAGVMGWPHNTLEPLFQTPPADPVKVMLMFTLSLSRPEDRALLEKQDVHVINLMVTEQTHAQWAAGDRGVTPARMNSSVIGPESAGATDPILVATTEPGGPAGLTRTMPIPERIDMAARRARRWVTLAEKPNASKRVVMLYYNNPPGKGNIGASYLNIAPSIHAVLTRLAREGYWLGDRPLPTATEILAQLELAGRNVEQWAPGELESMARQGNAMLIDSTRYREWFARLPEPFQRTVNARWGPPEKATLMALPTSDGRRLFVIPGLRLGNVFLGPQLLRASFAEYTNVQHSATLPPHHGYIAAYLFYRHQFNADAVVHLGRHGTLEWLPGKSVGQAGWDASEAILGDLPNANYYIMDGDGEAVQARRRSAAVDISHLTPMLAPAGEQSRFTALADALARWTEVRETSPALAAEYAARALAEAGRAGLLRQLSLENKPAAKALPRLEEFLESAEASPIPLGLPTLGTPPTPEREQGGLAAFLASGFTPAERADAQPRPAAWAADLAAGRPAAPPADWPAALRDKAARILSEGATWLAGVRMSAERELAMLPHVLAGRFLPSGLVGDPLRSPASLPAGRNLHQGDPATWPTPAAWEVGKRLAGDLIETYRAEHGRAPERISMVLWQGETGRHEGAMEAQAMYLMGVEPQWNARGAVDRLRLIPEAELGRPRVNVLFTVSGLYRDGLAEKIILLDRAARLAASAGDNALSRMNREVEQTLTARGMKPEEAREFAGARVFTTAPGSYGFGLEKMVEQSRDQEEPETMAELYLSKMNYVYTEKSWGARVPQLLESQLKGNEAILHSRSSNLYGAVDNDDVYQWMGGLRIASAAVGAAPSLYLNNLRKAGEEKFETARGFIATELNARNWNPRWIAEMQREGYSGAREMMKAVENLYGWQATAPETIAPEVWKKMYDVYVADEYHLGLEEFFDKTNPAAKQQLVARLLEVDRQGTYRLSDAERARAVKEYVRLVAKNGVACSANVCGNQRLREAVLKQAQQLATDPASAREAAEFARRFTEATASRPVFTSRAARPSPRRSGAAARGPLDLPVYTVREVTEAARRYVEEHAALILGSLAGISLAGALLALYRRRRPAAPPTELLLSGAEPKG